MTLPNECIHGRAIKGADDLHECVYCANSRLRVEVAALRYLLKRIRAECTTRQFNWRIEQCFPASLTDDIDAALTKEGK